MKRDLLIVLAIGSLVVAGRAADSSDLKDDKQKFSYSLGMSLGSNLKRSGIPADQLDTDVLVRGIKEAMSGAQPAMTEAEARDTIMAFQRKARAEQGEKNKKAGETFLAENKTKEGVQTLPSGLQYKVEAEGQGESPKPSDMVTVNYRGTLLDGTEFDSSIKRGQPAKFAVGGVIKGWSEALQKMKPGAKWKLFIPADLAYGERGNGFIIGPNATLIFDVELLSVEARPVTPTLPPSQPITSDIIKVPSKAEMDKGAKIEVIKASEAEKLQQAEKDKAEKDKAAKPADQPPK